ncbi:ABC transporter permease [Acidobacteria bacterium AB60]|nr:ABC transporter permease [Acidobacteria bacterium AB60]
MRFEANLSVLRFWRILRISLRNFGRFRLQAALIVVSTIAGTSGVLVSTGYSSGGRQKIVNQFDRLGTNVIIVTPQQSRSVGGRARTGRIVTTLNDADYRAIRSAEDLITASSPTVAAVLRIRAGDLTKNTAVIGCEPDYLRIKHWTVAQGSSFEEADDRRQARIVLLGSTAARDLFGTSDPVGEHVTISRVPFTVAGVLTERGQGLDAANEDDQVYVPLQTAMRRLLNVDYFASIQFQVDSVAHMDQVERVLTAQLEQRHKRSALTQPDFQVQNQQRLVETQLAAFERLTFYVRWIAFSTLAVSALGVLATTWIAVRNRTREIGVRRAVGATRTDILVQFLAEGMIGSFIGCATGLVAGYFLLQIVAKRAGQPFFFSPAAALAEAFVSMGLYAGFAAVSAARAIYIHPTGAFRAE